MSRPKLTYVVTWRNGAGHETQTEVVVRANDAAEGSRLAEKAAADIIGAEARPLHAGMQKRFFAESSPSRIEL